MGARNDQQTGVELAIRKLEQAADELRKAEALRLSERASEYIATGLRLVSEAGQALGRPPS